jgi:hypothetical protein
MGSDKKAQAKAWAEKEGKRVWDRQGREPKTPWTVYAIRVAFWTVLAVSFVGLTLHDGIFTPWGGVWHQ